MSPSVDESLNALAVFLDKCRDAGLYISTWGDLEPITDAEIDAIEAKVDRPIHADLRPLYRRGCFTGSISGEHEFGFGTVEFLPLARGGWCGRKMSSGCRLAPGIRRGSGPWFITCPAIPIRPARERQVTRWTPRNRRLWDN